jgi:cell wall-associated NlpC family hydrolase
MSVSSTSRAVRLAFVLCTTACLSASVAGAQTVSQQAKPFEAFFGATAASNAHSLRDSLVLLARAQVGRKYRHGGQSPQKGFDCSGLIKYIMAALNLDVPRTAKQQAGVGLAVNKDTSRLLPGDLLTFGKGKKGQVSHVGIYVGDGRYVHASSVAGKVIESKIDRPFSPLIKAWKGARRILSIDDSSVTVASGASKGGY